MKRTATLVLLAGALLACSPVPLLAQETKQASPTGSLDALRDAVRSDKRGLVERNLQLTPEEAKRFWPIYDAQQREQDKITQRLNRSIVEYVNQESTMSDANAKRIARDLLKASAEEEKLREKTFRQLTEALPARKAVRYLQIENKIRAVQRYEMAERVSLVR